MLDCGKEDILKQSSKKITLGTAALYCRLSRDDNMDNESNSISNQKKKGLSQNALVFKAFLI